MIHTTTPTRRIVINIECFDDIPDNNYVAWLEGEDYAGIIVSASSIPECINEIGISLKVLELYRKNLSKKK